MREHMKKIKILQTPTFELYLFIHLFVSNLATNIYLLK